MSRNVLAEMHEMRKWHSGIFLVSNSVFFCPFYICTFTNWVVDKNFIKIFPFPSNVCVFEQKKIVHQNWDFLWKLIMQETLFTILMYSQQVYLLSTSHSVLFQHWHSLMNWRAINRQKTVLMGYQVEKIFHYISREK